MLDSDDDPMLAAVGHLDDAAASLRRSDMSPDQIGPLLRLMEGVQRRLLAMTGAEPKPRTASPVVIVSPIH